MDELETGAGSGASAGTAASPNTGSAGAATPPSNSTPAAPAAAGTAGAGSTGAASAASGSAAAAASGSTGAAAAFSLREQLGGMGVDVKQFTDDASAWKYLQDHLGQMQGTVQQATDLARYGQYYLANRQRFEAQQAAQAAAPAAGQTEKPLWQVPEWNPQWENFFLKDPATGRVMTDQFGNPQVMPGADPSLGMKYNARRQWQRDTLESLLTDPVKTLEPLLDKFVSDRFGKMFEDKYKSQTGTQFVSDFLSPQKSPWLYQTGQDGKPLTNQFTGAPALSPAGQVFKGYAEHLDSIGVKDPQAAATLAQMLTEHAAMKAQLAGGGVQQTQQTATVADVNAANEAAKNQTVRNANGANRIANRHPAATPATPQAQPGRPRLRLGERLRTALKQGGGVN